MGGGACAPIEPSRHAARGLPQGSSWLVMMVARAPWSAEGVEVLFTRMAERYERDP